MIDRELLGALLTGKPYFGSAFAALQGVRQRHATMHATVGALARLKPAGPVRILEIGSWVGGSTITWARALERFLEDGEISCVDAWSPYFDLGNNPEEIYRTMNAAARSGLAWNLFDHNLRAAKVRDRVLPLVGPSRQILPGLRAEGFDLVFIDGSHQVDDVRFDLREAVRLLKDGGILCGDDLELQIPDCDEAFARETAAAGRDYARDPATGTSFHPGVTIAVHEMIGRTDPWDGFWAVRKESGGWKPIELAPEETIVPDHLTPPPPPVSLGHVGAYELLRMEGRVYGVPECLEAEDLLVGFRPGVEMPPPILAGTDPAELRSQIERGGSALPPSQIKLAATHEGYNIVKAGDMYVGISQSLGPIDLFRERVGQREFKPYILRDQSLEAMKGRITALIQAAPRG